MRPNIVIIVLLYKKSNKNEQWYITAITVRGTVKGRAWHRVFGDLKKKVKKKYVRVKIVVFRNSLGNY